MAASKDSPAKSSSTSDETTTPSGDATSGNVGLSPDVYADDRKVTEAATKTQQDWDEFHKVPEEALTPEAKEAIEQGEKKLAEEEKERQERADRASNPTAEGIAGPPGGQPRPAPVKSGPSADD